MRSNLAVATTTGPRRRNEDRSLAMNFDLAVGHGSHVDVERCSLLVLCDGMGGSENGDVAAQLVCDWYGNHGFGLARKLGELVEGALDDDRLDEDQLIRVLRASVNEMRKELADQCDQRGWEFSDAQTTLVGAIAYRDYAAVWWLGDSRAYLYRENVLIPLTKDHSPVAERDLNDEEARNEPDLNQIFKFIQADRNFDPGVVQLRLTPGDLVFLCSDGIWNTTGNDWLQLFFRYHLLADFPLKGIAAELVSLVEPAASDNATVAILSNGRPSSFAPDAAIVDPNNFTRQKVAQELLNQIGTTEHPGFDIPATAVSDKHVLQSPFSPTSAVRICGACDRSLASDESCPDHPQIPPFNGLIAEIWGPHGAGPHRIKLTDRLDLGRGLQLDPMAEAYLSPNHLRLEILPETGNIRIFDSNSDNGTWLRVRNVEIPPSWLDQGVELVLGHNLLVVRKTQALELIDEEVHEHSVDLDESGIDLEPPGTELLDDERDRSPLRKVVGAVAIALFAITVFRRGRSNG